MFKKTPKTALFFCLIILGTLLFMFPIVSAAQYKIVLNGSDISNVKGYYKIDGDSLILLPPSVQDWDSTHYAIWTFKINNPELVDRATADVEFIEESDYIHSASFFLNGLKMYEYTRGNDDQRWYQGFVKILLDTKLIKNSNTLKVEVPDWRTKFTVKKIIITINTIGPTPPPEPPVPTETTSAPPILPHINRENGIAIISILLTAIVFCAIEYLHKIKKI
jgi:hypothetical protein